MRVGAIKARRLRKTEAGRQELAVKSVGEFAELQARPGQPPAPLGTLHP